MLVLPGEEWPYYESFLGKSDDAIRGLLPDFMFVAPGKTGTTWMADLLRCHPDVFIPPEKELHYFDWKWKSTTLAGYVKTFAGAEGKLKCDATPYWLLPNCAIAAIKNLKPDLKIIMLPRWPPKRAWSQLRHMIAFREDMFKSGPESVAHCSDEQMLMFLLSDPCRGGDDYPAILARWTRHFDPSAIFVEYFESAVSEPEGFFQRLLAFLDLEVPGDFSQYPLHDPANVGSPVPAPAWFMAAAHSSTVAWQRDLADDLRGRFGLAPAWPKQEETYRGWPALICETADGTRVEFDGTVFTAGPGKGIAAPYLGDVLGMLEQPSLRSPANRLELEDIRLCRMTDRLFDRRAVPTVEALEQRMASMDATLVERDQRLSGMETTIEERNQRLAALERTLAERDRRLSALDTTLEERNRRLTAIEESLAERNRRLSTLEATLKERNQRLAAIEGTLDERNQRLTALEAGMSTSSQSLLALAVTLTERDQRLSALEVTLTERDQRLSGLETTLTERDQRLSALEVTLTERDQRLSGLETTLTERDQRLSALEGTLPERDQRLSALETTLDQRNQHLSALEVTLGERTHHLASLEATSAQWTHQPDSLESNGDTS